MAIGANVRHCANVRPKIWKDAAMSGANQTSKRKRRGKTLPALGVAGLSLALTSGAHAATDGTSVDKPTLNTLFSQEITLAEEEISDVSLSTFYVFDKENAQIPQLGQQLAFRGCGCGGCRCGGCGFHSCRCGGCHGCFRACRCGCGGCGGCGGFCF
jgi:hypothetical protein